MSRGMGCPGANEWTGGVGKRPIKCRKVQEESGDEGECMAVVVVEEKSNNQVGGGFLEFM